MTISGGLGLAGFAVDARICVNGWRWFLRACEGDCGRKCSWVKEVSPDCFSTGDWGMYKRGGGDKENIIGHQHQHPSSERRSMNRNTFTIQIDLFNWTWRFHKYLFWALQVKSKFIWMGQIITFMVGRCLDSGYGTTTNDETKFGNFPRVGCYEKYD